MSTAEKRGGGLFSGGYGTIWACVLLVLFLPPDAKLVPMTSEQVTEKPDTSTADTSYETSSVVSASILPQITEVIKAEEMLV